MLESVYMLAVLVTCYKLLSALNPSETVYFFKGRPLRYMITVAHTGLE